MDMRQCVRNHSSLYEGMRRHSSDNTVGDSPTVSFSLSIRTTHDKALLLHDHQKGRPEVYVFQRYLMYVDCWVSTDINRTVYGWILPQVKWNIFTHPRPTYRPLELCSSLMTKIQHVVNQLNCWASVFSLLIFINNFDFDKGVVNRPSSSNSQMIQILLVTWGQKYKFYNPTL